jgi:hypothetical protein
MNEARPYASLSSGLLARKGAAKPAMRPQSFGGFEDLGWNDMGSFAPSDDDAADLPEHVPSSIAALTPLPKSDEPSVVAQQRAIAESFDGEDEVQDFENAAESAAEHAGELAAEPEAPPPARAKAEVVNLPKRTATARPAPAVAVGGRKAAFTLRLDAERHLRLRLICAVTGRSAQQIVCGALDALLETIPEVEALAERVPAAKRR